MIYIQSNIEQSSCSRDIIYRKIFFLFFRNSSKQVLRINVIDVCSFYKICYNFYFACLFQQISAFTSFFLLINLLFFCVYNLRPNWTKSEVLGQLRWDYHNLICFSKGFLCFSSSNWQFFSFSFGRSIWLFYLTHGCSITAPQGVD